MNQLIHALGHEMTYYKCFLCIIVFNNVGGVSISIKLFPGMYLSYQQAWVNGSFAVQDNIYML